MEIEAPKLSLSLNTISSEELLENIKSYINLGLDINVLFTEFYNRFKNSFYQKCLRLSHTNGFDEHLAKDIYQQTFLKAFKEIAKFELEINLPEEKQKNTIVAWLTKIASNEFYDYLRKRIKTEEIQTEEKFESDYVMHDIDQHLESENIIKIREALLTLDERESYIIHQCNRYGCLELENKNHLPDDVIKDICQQFGIKSSYIRIIKMRALVKIRSFCLS